MWSFTSFTLWMKRSRPSAELLRSVCPGMTSYQRLFQTERPISRELVNWERASPPPP
jgi:hypothetical protein